MGTSLMSSGFRHILLAYSTPAEMADSVSSFLRAGWRADEPAIVCCTDQTVDLIGREFDPAQAAQIIRLDFDLTYASPAAAIAAYQDIADDLLSRGARRIRVVGEATAGGGSDDHLDWARYEAAVNHAFKTYPISALCTYDRGALPQDVLTYGCLTHPVRYVGTAVQPNAQYIEPAEFLRQTTRTRPYPLEREPPDLDMAALESPDRLRAELDRCLAGSPHLAQEAADLVMAANEVATNAFRHGTPPVGVHLWVRPDRLVCVITDHGPGIEDPFAGYLWPRRTDRLPTGGMGLWLARRLCDRLDMSHEAGASMVRLLILHGHTPPHPSRHDQPDPNGPAAGQE